MKKLKDLLKESFVWERQFGEKLPTLDSVQKKHQNKVNEKLQNSQGEGYTFGKGDIVKDINPDCPHHNAEGEVIKGGKVKITFKVTNNGKNFKEGDELEKSVDQMVKLNSDEINEGKLNEVSFPIRGKVSKSFKEYWRILLDLKIYHLNQAEREFPKYGREFKKAKKLASQLGDLLEKLSKVTK